MSSLRLVEAAAPAAARDLPPADVSAPRPSVGRAQRRQLTRLGLRAYRMQWHGKVPPIWEQLDGEHFDVLACTQLRASRARQAAELDNGATLYAPGTPCGVGVTVRACAPADAATSSSGPAPAVAHRRADAERLSLLHRTLRALSRPTLPAPPRADLRVGRAGALTMT